MKHHTLTRRAECTLVTHLSPARLQLRPGISLAELLVVVIMMGAVMSVTMPKLGSLRDRASVRSSKQELAAELGLARGAAVRRGRPAQVWMSANSLWVTVTSPNGTTSALGGKYRLDKSLGVTLTPAIDTVIYDQRGIASNKATSVVYKLVRNKVTDSVCVNRLGLVAKVCGI